jgi:hypothetical protein
MIARLPNRQGIRNVIAPSVCAGFYKRNVLVDTALHMSKIPHKSHFTILYVSVQVEGTWQNLATKTMDVILYPQIYTIAYTNFQ